MTQISKSFGRFFFKRVNLWAGFAIIIINLFAWAGVLFAAPEPYVVEPIRDPEIVTLLEYIRAGNHSGEKWEVTLTDLEAEQTITWYLGRYPQIPFEYPRVEISPDHISGEGDATIAGFRVHVGGKARVFLSNGLPQVEILEMSLPIPGPLRRAIENEIEIQLQRTDRLPVRFTSAEWDKGKVVVRGIVR